MDLTVPSGACARSRVLGDTVINNDAAGKERTPVQNCKICAAWCAWLQHHTPIELTAQPLPIRQILSHTSLETRSMTVLPQMRHFMYQYVFEELRRHETELHIQTNAASARRAGAPARGHHAQRDTRGRAADNRLPLIQQCRKLCVDIRSRLVARSLAPDKPAALLRRSGVTGTVRHGMFTCFAHTLPVTINPRTPPSHEIGNGRIRRTERRGNHHLAIRRLDAKVHVLDGLTGYRHGQSINQHVRIVPQGAVRRIPKVRRNA